jgi:hypothetical protein
MRICFTGSTDRSGEHEQNGQRHRHDDREHDRDAIGEAVLEVDETGGDAGRERIALQRSQVADQVLAGRAQRRVGRDHLDGVVAAGQLDRRPDLRHARQPRGVARELLRPVTSAARRELDRGVAEGREVGIAMRRRPGSRSRYRAAPGRRSR